MILMVQVLSSDYNGGSHVVRDYLFLFEADDAWIRLEDQFPQNENYFEADEALDITILCPHKGYWYISLKLWTNL